MDVAEYIRETSLSKGREPTSLDNGDTLVRYEDHNDKVNTKKLSNSKDKVDDESRCKNVKQTGMKEYKNVSKVSDDRVNKERSIQSKKLHGNANEVVRVDSKKPKPHCAHKKFQNLAKTERPPDPYFTPFEKDMQEEKETRKKFIGPVFVVTDHKAAVAKRETQMEASRSLGPSAPVPHMKNEREKFLTTQGWR